MKVESEDAKETATKTNAAARGHCLGAIDVLAEVMYQGDGAATARVSAAKAMLERGLGRAGLAPADDEERGPEVVRIERVIVDPVRHDPELERQYREYRGRDDEKDRLDS